MTPRTPALLALVPVTALLGGCGGAQALAEDGLQVVTSTNVYASLVTAIAGDAASVTPIIDNPAEDPHGYEATPQDKLTLAKADVVVLNGGGYDSFMTTMLESLDTQPIVVDAVEASGMQEDEAGHTDEGHTDDDHAEDAHSEEQHAHGDGEAHEEEGHSHGEHSFNEHIWYSVPAMERVSDAIAEGLSEADPEDAAELEAGAAAQAEEFATLTARIEEAHEAHEGTHVGLTEPVAGYLLADLGLHDEIDPAFRRAVESGDDVSAAAQRDALDVIESGDLAFLAVNEQTSGRAVAALEEAAGGAGVPVVPVSETLPDGATYIAWMDDTVTRMIAALEES